MALPLPKPKALQADKGYYGDRIRESLLMCGILPIIPPRSNGKPQSIQTIDATRSATASSRCSAN